MATLLLSEVVYLHTAMAQSSKARTPALSPLPAPVKMEAPPNANSVNVLILALDDLATQIFSARSAGNKQPAPVLFTPSLTPEVAPETLPPAIRPSAFNRATGRFSIEWQALSQKRKKDKVDKDADKFRAIPEAPPAYPVVKRPQDETSTTPPLNPAPSATPDVAADSRPETSPLALPSAPGLVGAETAATKPPGAAQIAAAPLRRALLRSGFTDVLTTSLDGSAIVRAVHSRRLSARVLDALQTSTAQLVSASLGSAPGSREGVAKTPDSALQLAAMQAAAQVGQALGYRAVLVLGVLPANLAGAPDQSTLDANPLALPQAPAAAPANGARPATFAMLIADALRDTGDILVFDESGAGDLARNEAAAATGAAVVTKTVGNWPTITDEEKKRRADDYMATARAAVASGNWEAAQDKLNQVLALDPNRAEASLMMGDVLAASDPEAAVSSYQRAVAQNAKDGATWAKIAISYTVNRIPNWPRALDAGRKALAAKFDSAELRQAMATAQLGRAELFRRAGRIDSAEDAELEARQHLDRALQLAPQDPGITRLMTRQLVVQGRYREALQSLDRVALQYPDDADIQTQYATSLLEIGGREEDAFVAWARVWKLTGQQVVPVEASRYRRLSEGFDQLVASLGKKAKQLTAGVASNSTPREAALLQLSRYKEDMAAAVAAIKIIQPGVDGQNGAVHASRIFSADLMSQALEAQQLYLETGQEVYRARAGELNRQSMITLNAARGHQG